MKNATKLQIKGKKVMENYTGLKVAAVVVTYNRKELLSECVDAVLKQSFPVWKLIIIDNASTDGTEDMLRQTGVLDNSVVDYRKMDTNLGGSGGFYKGIEIARGKDCDWIWIMDDDTIPHADCLEKLAEKTAVKPDASFFASCVKGEQDEPMNVTFVDARPTENGYADWYMELDKGIVKIQRATFVSLLLNKKAVEKVGLPLKDYFIWADDIEYTLRLTTHFAPAYLAGDSWVCHKRKNAKSISLKHENDPARIKNYHFYYRNSLTNIYLYYSRKAYVKRFFKYWTEGIKLAFTKPFGFKKLRACHKGIFEAVASKKKFRKIVSSQLKG